MEIRLKNELFFDFGQKMHNRCKILIENKLLKIVIALRTECYIVVY